ncbi:MAG: alpha/beta hydrolase [Desulfomonilaceae bacterium]
MNRYGIAAAFGLLLLLITIGLAEAQEKSVVKSGNCEDAPRKIPMRIIPTPLDVSPELRKVIACPLTSLVDVSPKTSKEWHDLVSKKSALDLPIIKKLQDLFPVNIKIEILDGVKTFTVTPEKILEDNKNRVLMHLHGGGYVFNPGKTGLGEAILMAYYGKIKVISVDYRMAPDFPFPAALDDTVTVYKQILKSYKATNIGVFGTSSGGALTAATVLKLREIGVSLPGAVSLGTPWVDLTQTGDSLFTNEYIDDVIVKYNGMLEACAKVYAGAHDMKDPFVSPLYADFSKGFPPAILTTGTRDLLLSDTVRLHRKLRQAGIDTELQVFEGMSHAQYILVFNSPESKEAFEEIAKFFRGHLSH